MSRAQLAANEVFLQKTTEAIQRRHDRAEDLYDRVKVHRDRNDRNLYIVPSFNVIGEIYKVRRVSLDNHACNMYCNVCEACVHEFTCDCPDASDKANFCKHMHVICLIDPELLPLYPRTADNGRTGSDSVTGSSSSNMVNDIINRNLRADPDAPLRQRAEAAIVKFLPKLDQYTSDESLKEIIKTMSELESKIEAFEVSNEIIDPCT